MPIDKTLKKATEALLLLSGFGFSQVFAISAKNEPLRTTSPSSAASSAPIKMQGTHRNNTFGFTATNYGLFGNQNNPNGLPDSFDGLPSVSLEFPLASKIEYLFQGAIWVGGIVNGDTLVSTGTDGWAVDDFEINPSSNPADLTAQKRGGGAQEIIFNSTDTLILGSDGVDGRYHKPLGLSFLQKSFVFAPAAGTDSFAIIYLRMQNIGSNNIEKLYFGLLMDGDVGHPSRGPYFEDDLAGFVDSSLIPGTPLQGDIACIWDNDGDPSGSSFLANSARGTTGIKLIASSQPITQKSFNWWTPNQNVALDWGPQKAPGRRNLSGGLGQPEGDKMKYYYLSNGEIDYPQVQSAIDHSAGGWLPPLSPQANAIDIANGYDTRYLVSYGSVDLTAGDTLTLVFAATLGNNLHVTPSNFANNLGSISSRYLDTARTNSYLRGLGFGSLIHNAMLAESLWNAGFQNLVLGPPLNVRFLELDDSTVRLFVPQPSELENGFNVYRSTDSNGVYIKVNGGLVTDTMFDDLPLTQAQLYWYKFTTVSNANIEGPLGGRIGPVAPGRPRAPTNVTNRSDQVGNIYLSWLRPPETDLVRFRVYRTPIPGPSTFSLFDSVSAAETSYTDVGSIAGQRFSYQVTAVDSFGLESYVSDITSAMRFVFGNRVLLVDRTGYNFFHSGTQTAARDSLLQFHSRLLRRLDFDTLDLNDRSFKFNIDPAFVSKNPVIVVHSSEFVTFDDDPSFLAYFLDYLKAGGKLIIAGHWHLGSGIPSSLCNYRPFFLPNPAITQPTWDAIRTNFGFDCLFSPASYPSDSSLISNSFLSAKPKNSNYSILQADSPRVDLFVRTNQRAHYQYRTVPNIGYFTSRNPSEDLYTFGSILGGADPKNGTTVATEHLDPATGGGFVWFNFPLFFMQEDSAKKAFRQALADLGVQENFPKGDLDRDGILRLEDIVYLLNYVFLGEPFPIFDGTEADMNCDNLATAADVVLLINHVFLTTPLPCN